MKNRNIDCQFDIFRKIQEFTYEGLSEVEHNTYNQPSLEQDFDGVLFYVALTAARR